MIYTMNIFTVHKYNQAPLSELEIGVELGGE